VARTTFTAEVLTPEGEVFNDEVEMVSTRTSVGSIGILANHQPLLGMLEPTELRLYKSESDVVTYAQGEGYVQVAEGRVLILVEEAVDPSSLNTSELQEKLRTAERELESAEDGSEAARVAGRDKRRWEAFLRLTQGGAGGEH
jgi:F-type H+-transporting ATPase subunit epsilon